MTENAWEVNAVLTREPDGVINLSIEHEKGRSVLILISGQFWFKDWPSLGAFADLLES